MIKRYEIVSFSMQSSNPDRVRMPRYSSVMYGRALSDAAITGAGSASKTQTRLGAHYH